MQAILDNFPVATVTFLAGVVVTIWAYASGDVSFTDALLALGGLGGGTGVVGIARAQSGKGVKH